MATHTWERYALNTTTTSGAPYTEYNEGEIEVTLPTTASVMVANSYSFDAANGRFVINTGNAQSMRGSQILTNLYQTYVYSLYERSGTIVGSTFYDDVMYIWKENAGFTGNGYRLIADRITVKPTVTTTTTRGEYIDTVTSSNAAAYPADGRQGNYWYVKINVSPIVPGAPSFASEIKGGDSIAVTWTAAADPEGSLSGYELEVRIDGGSWSRIYKGSSRSYTYTVPEDAETIAFRVRAYDSSGAYSAYAVSSDVSVSKGGFEGYVKISGVLCELTGYGYVKINGSLCQITGYEVIRKESSPSTGLPDGYTQVNYLESSGNQYIDTGYYAVSEKLKISTGFMLTEVQAWHALWGCEETDSGPWALTPLVNESSQLVFYNGSNSRVGAIPVTANVIYSLICESDNGVLTYECGNAEGTDYTGGSLCKTDSIYMFTLNSANTASVINQASKMRIYSFEIYDNGVLVRDFIPCLNNTGDAGMWDRVNGIFYVNSGTGAFTYG